MSAAASTGDAPPALLSLGPWLKQRRRILDMTQDELAQKSVCSLATIRKIEAGDLLPSKQLAQQIAVALKVDEADHAAFVAFARAERAAVAASAFSALPQPSDRFVRPLEEAPIRAFRVPAQLTPLVGREWEVQASCALLRRPVARLLTLTGPPGSGKTRLALAVAENLQSEFSGGALFVPLATITEAALVPGAIAQALGVRVNSVANAVRSQIDDLIEHLRTRPLLLLLDNFEQVIDAAPILTELLMAAAGLKLLVTSRSLLRLYGEHEFPVPPLPLPDVNEAPLPTDLLLYPAVELFVQRAQAALPTFALTDENAKAIVQICTWVEGLPLAIEMAAAQVKWNAPQVLLALLHNRLAALNSGPRYLAPRQQTLRGAIEWSYNLLDAEEKKLFDSLAPFVGGFTVEAATAIVTGVGALSVRLQSLVDHSLLRHLAYEDVPPRYEMLETIREFALERLATTGVLSMMQQVHAAHFLRVAQGAAIHMHASDQELWLDRLEADHNNLRAALHWCLANDVATGLELASALEEFWYVRGNLSEGRSYLEALLGQNTELTPILVRANAMRASGYLAFRQGDQLDAEPILAEALALYRTLDDQPGIATTLHHIGIAAFHQNQYGRARELYEQSLVIYQDLGATGQMAVVLKDLGLVAKDLGELDQAMTYFERALGLQRAIGNSYGVARCLTSMSVVAYWQGDYQKAGDLGLQSLAIQRELGDALGIAYTLENVGMATFKLGNFETSVQQMEECLSLFRTTGDKMGVVLALDNLGIFALAQGRRAEAIRLHSESLNIAWQIQEKRRIAFCLEGLAADSGLSERSVQLLAAAAALRQAINAPLLPADMAEHESFLSKLQHHLGADRFDHAWQVGASRSLDEAIDFALTP